MMKAIVHWRRYFKTKQKNNQYAPFLSSTLLMLGFLLDRKEWPIEWFHQSHSALRDRRCCSSTTRPHGGALYPSVGRFCSPQVAGWEFSMHWFQDMQCVHGLNCSLLAWSLGIHPGGGCVCWSMYMCVRVCVFTGLERFIAVSMQPLEASGDQVTKHE